MAFTETSPKGLRTGEKILQKKSGVLSRPPDNILLKRLFLVKKLLHALKKALFVGVRLRLEVG